MVERLLRFKAGRVEPKRADDLSERGLKHVPLIKTVLVDRHPERCGGHVCGRRRRELGTHRCHFEAFDQRVIAMALHELEPERIEEDQRDALVTFDPASHLGRDVGEVPHAAHCCRSLLPAWRGPARVKTFCCWHRAAARRDDRQSSYASRRWKVASSSAPSTRRTRSMVSESSRPSNRNNAT